MADIKMKLTFLIIFSAIPVIVHSAGLNEEFTWSRITYRWPKRGPSKRQIQTDSRNRGTGRYARPTGPPGTPDVIVFDADTNADSVANRPGQEVVPSFIDYRYETNIPMGANVWRNKLFITVPRRRLGVPSSLNYVPLDSKVRHNVPLIPYPNWQINLYPSPDNSSDSIVSVYRIAIDPCDRLWAVDTGIIETLGNPTQVKPTAIIAIDLNSNRIIHRHEIPTANLRPNSGLAYVRVDVTKDTCDDAYLYIPDLSGYGLVVFSLRQDRSWRVTHNYFYVEPLAGEFFVSGHNFQWNDGIFSCELSKIKPDGFRDLYFHAMAGTHIYRVSTRILRNETLATRTYHGNDFEIVGDRASNSQTSAADIHQPSNTMFLALVNQNAVGCWNIRKPLDTISIVQKDDRRMIYPSDVKVSNDRVYILTNTMPEFLYGQLDYNQTNFRVWSNTVEKATQGTMCQ